MTADAQDSVAVQDSSTRTKWALLIGINRYLYIPPNKQLHGCVGDIVKIREFLIERAHFPAANVLTLLASLDGDQDRVPIPPELHDAKEPTAQKIQEYFKALVREVGPDDDVVIYYSGHGVRVSNPQQPLERVYGFAAMDVQIQNGTWANLVIDRDLNDYLGHIVEVGATLTQIFDSCHSAGATRDLEEPSVRQLVIGDLVPGQPAQAELTPEQWSAFRAEHELKDEDVRPATGSRGLAESGWMQPAGTPEAWVSLAGCREFETSKEVPPWPRTPDNGAMTSALLNALRDTPAERVPGLLWGDLFAQVCQGVRDLNVRDQTPVLEGYKERPVFGGAWRPYDPGYTVTAVDGQRLSLDGGIMQGLDTGAEVAIYPPGTDDFAVAEPTGKASITSAAPISSQAELGEGGTAVVGSRVRLTKPAAGIAPLGVVLTGVPEIMKAAMIAVREFNDFAILRDLAHPNDVEVRPWDDTGRRWAIVTPAGQQDAKPDNVIAYAPELDDNRFEAQPPDEAALTLLGTALGEGLVHWARYVNVRDRESNDDVLKKLNLIQPRLWSGADSEAMHRALNTGTLGNVAQALTPEDGVYEVTDKTALLLELQAKRGAPYGLLGGLLLCSDDGNIMLAWPPPNGEGRLAHPAGASENLSGDETRYIGSNGDYPSYLIIRDDQQTSRYTFKIFAYTPAGDQEQLDLTSLEQGQTVQEVITGVITSTRDRGDWGQRTANVPTGVWTSLRLDVRVHRS
jgi:hypothetical protein